MKFSIITINRNNAVGLRKTIESVLAQTYTNFEYIIIDGDSTDNSVDIIKEYSDKISYWVSEPDGGIYNAMNKGLKMASGEYINFMNSGDLFYNNVVLEDVFKLNRSEDIIYGNACLVNNGTVLNYTPYIDTPSLFHFYDDGLCHQTIIAKRSLFGNEGFNERFKIHSDRDFLIRNIIVKDCSTYCIKKTICCFDMSGVSSDVNLKVKSDVEKSAILSLYFSKSILNDYKEYKLLSHKYSQQIYSNIEKLKMNPHLYIIVRRVIKILVLLQDKFKK